jgi:hypothetical protein
MQREWQPEEVIASWTLIDRDWELLANKSGATRLGFALLLRFFDLEAGFPAHPGELPQAAVEYVAGQVKVPPDAVADYEWSGRTIKYHRAQIRRAFGFREPTRADELRLTERLAGEVCSSLSAVAYLIGWSYCWAISSQRIGLVRICSSPS